MSTRKHDARLSTTSVRAREAACDVCRCEGGGNVSDSDGECVFELEAGTRTSDAAGRVSRAWAVRQREARERQKKSINRQFIRGGVGMTVTIF